MSANRTISVHGYTASGEQVTVTLDVEKLRQALAADHVPEPEGCCCRHGEAMCMDCLAGHHRACFVKAKARATT